MTHVTQTTVGQWQRFEGALKHSEPVADPYADVALTVTYTAPDGRRIPFWGFYDGDQMWRFRFMPDQIGAWSYEAAFSDGSGRIEGRFTCTESDLPGMLAVDESNPQWFGYKGGKHVLVRSFHVGDSFFAANMPAERRRAFLDWVQQQGYNMLSIGSHYLNRCKPGRGAEWDTPRLWPLNAAEYQRMEIILDDLAARRILVFPFGGFFGRDTHFPIDPADQQAYIRYTLTRLGAYWNILLNVSGPEPLLNKPHAPLNLSKDELRRLAKIIRDNDVFGHPLTVHNQTGDDEFADEDYIDYVTLQGPKTTDLQVLSDGLLRNHHPARPLYAQETLWSGNQFHPDYTDEQLRKNAYVILLSAAALNFIDNGGPEAGQMGDSSTGFSGSLNLNDRRQWRHDIIRRVWDTFSTFSFHTMTPRQDLVSRGFCLAAPGQHYLIYLDSRGSVNVRIEGGTYRVTWINAQDGQDRVMGASTSDGQGLTTPSHGDDWLVYLNRQ